MWMTKLTFFYIVSYCLLEVLASDINSEGITMYVKRHKTYNQKETMQSQIYGATASIKSIDSIQVFVCSGILFMVINMKHLCKVMNYNQVSCWCKLWGWRLRELEPCPPTSLVDVRFNAGSSCSKAQEGNLCGVGNRSAFYLNFHIHSRKISLWGFPSDELGFSGVNTAVCWWSKVGL